MTFLISPLDQYWLVRFFKGGSWVRTKERGWIPEETYEEYLRFGYDPMRIR